MVELYRRYPGTQLVAISHRQRSLVPELSPLPMVHHGLDPCRYAMGGGSGGYCAFLGRIAPEKAPHLAIDAARKAGLIVMGARHWNQIPASLRDFAPIPIRNTRLHRPALAPPDRPSIDTPGQGRS